MDPTVYFDSLFTHGFSLAPPNIAPENIIIYRPIRASATGAILGGANNWINPKMFAESRQCKIPDFATISDFLIEYIEIHDKLN